MDDIVQDVRHVRRQIPESELEAFLAEPLLATLATYRRDGSVLLSPVWHEYSRGGFSVVLGADDVKTRHLRRDPRTSLVVAQQDVPYAGAEIRTRARFTEDDGRELILRMAIRYLGDQMGHAYADDTDDDPQVVVRLEPGMMRVWDFADDFGGA
jgi:PPOX class probable F420-dependent enzyme